MSSDVKRGLRHLQKHAAPFLKTFYGKLEALFPFGDDPEGNLLGYCQYLDIGNELLRGFDCERFLGRSISASFRIDATLYELFIVGFDAKWLQPPAPGRRSRRPVPA